MNEHSDKKEMDPKRWQKVKELFEAASNLDGEDRRNLLEKMCGDDKNLLIEVEKLIVSLEDSDTFLEHPAALEAASMFEERKSSDQGRTTSEGDLSRFVAGTVLASRYRILGLVGKGGMGEVYKAEDLKLSQIIALKFLPDSLATSEDALARFRGEVRMARQVSHPNVCRVFDISELDGHHFLSMEYVDGDDLSSLLKRVGRFSSERAVDIARQLCIGLGAIHKAGILHRDLKPANIIIDSKGIARITDFGIAGLEADINGDGLRIGTPAYMSPEQITGNEVSVQSDIYSLGLVLYEIFTGKQAFSSDNVIDLIKRQQTEPPTNPSELVKGIDPLVESVINQCLEKSPDDRPLSALHVAMALPGGNPLQIALDAGQTPSPEMVAAAPKKGTLSVRTAALCFAACIFLLIFSAFIEYKYWVIPKGEKSSEVLAERAKTIASNLGYVETPADIKYSFAPEWKIFDYARENTEFGEKVWEMMHTGQPYLREFRYRQSLHPIVPIGGKYVNVNDPEMTKPGDVRVITDPVGRLTGFEAVPPASSAISEKRSADWAKLFTEAGLNIQDFEPVSSDMVPPRFADERSTWTGPFISDPSIKVRVEAAAFEGRPVYFMVLTPWTESTVVDSTVPPIGIQVFIFSLGIIMFIVISVLSWHNFRMGRGDFRGSVRVMAFFLIVKFVTGLLLADHAVSILGEMTILATIIKEGVTTAAVAGLIYSALEPQFRRLWPEILISWSRLLAGEIRDPLVGRDVLIGSLLGLVAYATVVLQGVLQIWVFGKPIEPISHYFQWDGLIHGFADSVNFLIVALIQSLIFIFILFIALFTSRRKWIALGAIFLLYVIIGLTQPGYQDQLPLKIAFELILALTLTVAIKRFGIVGAAAHQLFFIMMLNRPFIFNPQSIYFEVSISGAIFIAAILLYGFYVSTGGRMSNLTKLLDDTRLTGSGSIR